MSRAPRARDRSAIVTRVVGGLVALAVVCAAIVGVPALLDRLRTEEAPVEAAEIATATADLRDLSESYTATGTLHYEDPIDVAAPTGGTVLGVVDPAAMLTNGDVVVQVDDTAVVWLAGATPAWRAMTEGDEGIDVLQLETALVALGLDPEGTVTVDTEFTAATAALVEDWQASLGVEETGRVALGTVVFGGDRTRVATVEVAVGARVAQGATVASLGSTTRVATLEAPAAEAITLSVGDPADVELPDRSVVDGTIIAVDPARETWTVTVGFADDTVFPPTDVANVEMTWSHAIATDVLTIPSAALLRLDDGTYVVDRVDDGGATTRTPVTIGSAVGTRVEIIGGLVEGSRVVTL